MTFYKTASPKMCSMPSLQERIHYIILSTISHYIIVGPIILSLRYIRHHLRFDDA